LEHVPAANEQTRKPRVLVVEDDRASRSAMIALLEMSGFDALPATTVAEAIEMLRWRPAVVILDLMLPDQNGAAVLAHIGQQTLPIRVVVTTGAIEWEKMLRQSQTAPDLVLQKPVDFKELLTWLQTQASKPNAARES
jgi:CheY-like chemotaxis protein